MPLFVAMETVQLMAIELLYKGQYVPLVHARETVHVITRAPLWKGNMCLCLLLWKLYT